MASFPLRVGLIGVQPNRSWAAVAHLPALRALPESFDIVGVANSSYQSAEHAARECGIPKAFESTAALIKSPEIDVVAVTVKVPYHYDLVASALAAGKHVYCEWPLGNGLAETEKLAALAAAQRQVAVVGLQALGSEQLRFVKDLIQDGYVGKVLSTSLIGSGMNWGPVIDSANAYTLDPKNGATMLTIPVGHTLAAIESLLGPLDTVSSVMATRRSTAKIRESGETIPVSVADQIVVSGTLASGAPLSLHYRGGMPRGAGLLWEIHGENGDLQITGMGGHVQFVDLQISGGRGDEKQLQPLAFPEKYHRHRELPSRSGNIANMYEAMAADIRQGTHRAPSFDIAVATYRAVDAIERAALQGHQVKIDGK